MESWAGTAPPVEVPRSLPTPAAAVNKAVPDCRHSNWGTLRISLRLCASQGRAGPGMGRWETAPLEPRPVAFGIGSPAALHRMRIPPWGCRWLARLRPGRHGEQDGGGAAAGLVQEPLPRRQAQTRIRPCRVVSALSTCTRALGVPLAGSLVRFPTQVPGPQC